MGTSSSLLEWGEFLVALLLLLVLFAQCALFDLSLVVLTSPAHPFSPPPTHLLNRSVFVGADKVTGEIVALKRINTEAEENGFPITAIREVKILKALKHDNIVLLKEIVTSKGEFHAYVCIIIWQDDAIPRRINLFVHFHRLLSTG